MVALAAKSTSSIWLTIDRSRPFNPANRFGEGWSFAKEDEPPLLLEEIDITAIQLALLLRDEERYSTGEEQLARLKKDGRIRLDLEIGLAMQAERMFLPAWKERTADNHRKYLFFDERPLLSPSGERYGFYLFWRSGTVYDGLRPLANPRNSNDFSAVL